MRFTLVNLAGGTFLHKNTFSSLLSFISNIISSRSVLTAASPVVTSFDSYRKRASLSKASKARESPVLSKEESALIKMINQNVLSCFHKRSLCFFRSSSGGLKTGQDPESQQHSRGRRRVLRMQHRRKAKALQNRMEVRRKFCVFVNPN